MLQIYNLNCNDQCICHFIESIWRKKSIVSICKYIILEIIKLEINTYVDSKKNIQLYVQLFGNNETFKNFNFIFNNNEKISN